MASAMSSGVPEDGGDRRVSPRTPPAPKKPLDVFLKEFEERLARGEPATTAGQMLEERAGGTWRAPSAAVAATEPEEVALEGGETRQEEAEAPGHRVRKRRHKHRRGH